MLAGAAGADDATEGAAGFAVGVRTSRGDDDAVVDATTDAVADALTGLAETIADGSATMTGDDDDADDVVGAAAVSIGRLIRRWMTKAPTATKKSATNPIASSGVLLLRAGSLALFEELELLLGFARRSGSMVVRGRGVVSRTLVIDRADE